MNTPPADYGILYIDDEEKSLKYFSAIFESIAPIYVARSPEEGYDTFVEHHEHLALVLSDKKMPNESGIDLLRRIQEYDSRPFRFLVTAFADLNVAVDALNDGLLYSYLSKPWDPTDLENRLVKAIKHYALIREKEQLLAQKEEAFRQLSMADKAASMGILSTGLNHHLRNSLTVIRTFHDILPFQLEDELDGPPKDKAFWTEFHDEVGVQMERMTDLLSKLAEGVEASSIMKTDPISLPDLVEETVQMACSDSENVDFQIVSKSACPEIQGDDDKVRQLLRMLIIEAKALFTDGKGTIEIQTMGVGKEVKIVVLNDGNLISKSDLQHLFDPFFVRSNTPEELGTNLLACYQIVVNHGGTIRAFHSEDGRNGIEFQLPSIPPKQTLAERAENARNLFGERSLVLSKACETILPS